MPTIQEVIGSTPEFKSNSKKLTELDEGVFFSLLGSFLGPSDPLCTTFEQRISTSDATYEETKVELNNEDKFNCSDSMSSISSMSSSIEKIDVKLKDVLLDLEGQAKKSNFPEKQLTGQQNSKSYISPNQDVLAEILPRVKLSNSEQGCSKLLLEETDINEVNKLQKDQTKIIDHSLDQPMEEFGLTKETRPVTIELKSNSEILNQTPEFSRDIVNITEKRDLDLGKVIEKTVSFSKATEEIKEFIKEKARIFRDGDLTELKMTLKPAHLGRIVLQVQMKDGVFSAKIITEHLVAKEMVENALPQLKEAIQNQGIRSGNVDVSLMDYQEDKQQDLWQRKRENKKNNQKKYKIDEIYQEENVAIQNLLHRKTTNSTIEYHA